MSVENYNESQYKLERTDKAIEKNEARLQRSQKDLAVAAARLDQRVRGMYQKGRTSYLEALFSSKSLTDFLNRLDLMGKIGTQDSAVLEQIDTYRVQVGEQKQQLAADRKKQKQLVAQAEAAKADIARTIANRKQALRGKEAEVAQLEREERQRQARLAEQARQAAAAARAAARAQSQAQQAASAAPAASAPSASGGSSSDDSNRPAAAPSRNVPVSRTGVAVVDVAMRYMGVPYRWGGASPSGFDCSGFTMYVYAQVGVGLPHSSRAQYNSGPRVSRGELRPGDLVFFGSPIHHVGLYVGGGSMIEAPYSGASVRVRSIDRRDYVGAVRPG